MYYDERYDPDECHEMVDQFADPGGHSALRRAIKSNPRNLPCPKCGLPPPRQAPVRWYPGGRWLEEMNPVVSGGPVF